MGGLFSRDQAIVIPLPGKESSLVNQTVQTTNAILAATRRLGCTPKILHEEHSIVYIMLCALLYNLERSSTRTSAELQNHAMQEICDQPVKTAMTTAVRKWIAEVSKQPAIQSMDSNTKDDVTQAILEINNWIIEIIEVICKMQSEESTKGEFKKIIQGIYDAACPNHKKEIVARQLVRDDTNQMAMMALQYGYAIVGRESVESLKEELQDNGMSFQLIPISQGKKPKPLTNPNSAKNDVRNVHD